MSEKGEAMPNDNQESSRRRGFLKTLGLGTAAAAASTAPALAASPRADAVPARDARKEGRENRRAARFQPNSPHVQAFIRTNRYEY